MGILCGLCSHDLPEICRTVDKTGQTYPGYCNQYCFTAFHQGIREKVPLRNYSDHAKLNGHMVWPYINIPCGWCTDNTIEIKHNYFGRSNRVFCSRACYKALCKAAGRRSFMKFIILRNLAINPTGSMLRVYVARGSIKAISSPSGPTEYQIASRVVNSPTPLGKYV